MKLYFAVGSSIVLHHLIFFTLWIWHLPVVWGCSIIFIIISYYFLLFTFIHAEWFGKKSEM